MKANFGSKVERMFQQLESNKGGTFEIMSPLTSGDVQARANDSRDALAWISEKYEC